MLLALGEVAGELRKSEQLAAVVAQRGDHHVRPEAGAVLAYAPALVFEAPLGRRHAQLVIRPAAVDRVARIERREVPADDVLGAKALETLSAEIPRDHVPFEVEHEDGVVLRLFDNESVEPVVYGWLDWHRFLGTPRTRRRFRRAHRGAVRHAASSPPVQVYWPAPRRRTASCTNPRRGGTAGMAGVDNRGYDHSTPVNVTTTHPAVSRARACPVQQKGCHSSSRARAGALAGTPVALPSG